MPPVVLPVERECTTGLFFLILLGTLVTGEPVTSGLETRVELLTEARLSIRYVRHP